MSQVTHSQILIVCVFSGCITLAMLLIVRKRGMSEMLISPHDTRSDLVCVRVSGHGECFSVNMEIIT